ncbi:MAG: energy transducer TonB [Rubrivivax sp.]|nr:energy transducer TonB [Rubrivivax sp.]
MPPPIVILTLPEDAAPAAPARGAGLDQAAVAPLRAGSATAPLPGDSARAPLPQVPPVVAAAAPQLVHLVQPEVPPRLLDQLAGAEVSVEFTIAADGRVSGISVLPPVPRPLVPLITAAIEQWRYAPLPAARPHRVQLVFKDGR